MSELFNQEFFLIVILHGPLLGKEQSKKGSLYLK